MLSLQIFLSENSGKLDLLRTGRLLVPQSDTVHLRRLTSIFGLKANLTKQQDS